MNIGFIKKFYSIEKKKEMRIDSINHQQINRIGPHSIQKAVPAIENDKLNTFYSRT